jgi:hypothetical protein
MGHDFWTAIPFCVSAVIITALICGTVLLYQRGYKRY